MTARAAGAFRVVWRGMGAWKWPCLVLVLLCLGLTPLAGRSPTASAWWKLPERTTGTIKFHASTNGQLRAGEELRVRFRFTNGAPQGMRCRAGAAQWRPLDLSAKQQGQYSIVLRAPKDARCFLLECELQADGVRLPVSWDLGRPVTFGLRTEDGSEATPIARK